jgi:hypothetical protein
MGLELSGAVRHTPNAGTAQSGVAKILLETDELILRGEVKARIPRRALTTAVAKRGVVTVAYDGGTLSLTLGDDAEKFVKKALEAPKSRLEKMGITSGSAIVALGIRDPAFATECKAESITVATRAVKDSALIVLGVERASDLGRIATAAKALKKDGALWVIHPKGTAGVKDTDIFAAAKQSGLTYVKVARFNDTHTAEKLVYPRSAR